MKKYLLNRDLSDYKNYLNDFHQINVTMYNGVKATYTYNRNSGTIAGEQVESETLYIGIIDEPKFSMKNYYINDLFRIIETDDIGDFKDLAVELNNNVNVILSQYGGHNNELYKAQFIDNEIIVGGSFQQNFNIDTLQITLNTNGFTNKLFNMNYCIIPELERCYYITSCDIINNLMTISLQCDTLYTNNLQILRLKPLLKNSTNYYRYEEAPYIDNNLPIESGQQYEFIELTGNQFIDTSSEWDNSNVLLVKVVK